MDYKIILWDIDSTLLNFKAAEYAAIKKCFEVTGLGKCTDEMIAEYSRINTRHWEALERGELTKQQVLVGRFVEFFRGQGLPTDKAEIFNSEYQVRLGDTICFEPGAPDILDTVRNMGIRQYIVTNGTKIAQDKKLSKSGIINRIDGVYISEIVGIEKPNKAYFDKVLDDIRKSYLYTGQPNAENEAPGYDSFPSSDQILIVGDSLTSDIRGGNNAGIKTCWYNPDHKIPNTDVKIDYEISCLNELLDIIS